MTGINRDDTYQLILSTDVKPTVATNKDVILEVDTGVWFVFYEGTWYPQNTTPL